MTSLRQKPLFIDRIECLFPLPGNLKTIPASPRDSTHRVQSGTFRFAPGNQPHPFSAHDSFDPAPQERSPGGHSVRPPGYDCLALQIWIRNQYLSFRESISSTIRHLSRSFNLLHSWISRRCSGIMPIRLSISKNCDSVIPIPRQMHSSVAIEGSVFRLNILRTVDHGISASLATLYIVHPRSSISCCNLPFTSIKSPLLI